jgi:hypothetical protein
MKYLRHELKNLSEGVVRAFAILEAYIDFAEDNKRKCQQNGWKEAEGICGKMIEAAQAEYVLLAKKNGYDVK